MDWDINVAGVNDVLQKTVTAAEPFDGYAKTYGTSLQGLAEGLNWQMFSVVAASLGEYAQHWAPNLEAAAKQVGASVTGAQNAVKAYMGGQEEMALRAQQAAQNGVIPDPPGGGNAGGRNRAV
ncbi:DUF6507 family protein [Kribbella sp. NPDC004875]|uniref:DUF6507 family protein n=1 Tax=Kribbella sp. NPDC004875 TaxID=3364107 RepID=UPI0036B99011